MKIMEMMQYKTEVTRFLSRALIFIMHWLDCLKNLFNFKFHGIYLYGKLKDFLICQHVPCGPFKLFARLQINEQFVSLQLLTSSKVVSSGNMK